MKNIMVLVIALLTGTSHVYANTEFESVFVTTGFWTDANEAEHEFLYSLDLTADHHFDEFGLFAWAEYSRTPKPFGISNLFGNTSGDAGTTASGTGNGRLQLSSLFFHTLDKKADYQWQVGLIEVSTLIDTSSISNDEVSQFLSSTFVNNLTINFPDYALSARLEAHDWLQDSVVRLVVSSGMGMSDSESATYSEAFDVFETNNGVFYAAEILHQQADWLLNAGYWRNTNHALSEADNTTPAQWHESGSGYWLGAERPIGEGTIHFRFGSANVDETGSVAVNNEITQFSSISWQQPLTMPGVSNATASIGYADMQTVNGDEQHIEGYIRFSVLDELYLSPSFQWLQTQEADGAVMIWGIRTEFWF